MDPGVKHRAASVHGAMFTNHILQRTVVLPELRVLFLPVPKAGCTSVLWLLADLAGIPSERFARSSLAEVTPALTVHDMNRVGAAPARGLRGRRARARADRGRVAAVHDRARPVRRLWSAWQTKLLLREPRFVDAFGDQPWFPRCPSGPPDLLEDFRSFVAALPRAPSRTSTGPYSTSSLAQLPLTHVGRLERFDETLALLREHVGDRWPGDPGRENRGALPMPATRMKRPAPSSCASGTRPTWRRTATRSPTRRPIPDGRTAWRRCCRCCAA